MDTNNIIAQPAPAITVNTDMANKATINGPVTIDRAAHRLIRVKRSIEMLEVDIGLFDIPLRKRRKAKLDRLRKEEKNLEAELSGIRKAINQATG